jgi:hypothetical protein
MISWQLPREASKISTGLGAVSVPPRPCGSSACSVKWSRITTVERSPVVSELELAKRACAASAFARNVLWSAPSCCVVDHCGETRWPEPVCTRVRTHSVLLYSESMNAIITSPIAITSLLLPSVSQTLGECRETGLAFFFVPACCNN